MKGVNNVQANNSWIYAQYIVKPAWVFGTHVHLCCAICLFKDLKDHRKTKVGVQLVRSFSRLTRDRKEWATKQFVLPKLKISESTKVFLGSF